VAQAYIADLSSPEERSKRMGLIGMAFGLGFICGPAIAVAALLWLGLPGPGWVAAAICLVNFLLAWFLLGESRPPHSAPVVRTGGRFDHWREVLHRPRIGLLVGVFFLATFAFTCFETTLGLLIAQNFHFAKGGIDSEIAISFLFAFCGLIGAFVQGGAIGRLVRILGESRLIALSLLLTAVSLAPLPFFGGHIHVSLSQLWKDPDTSRWQFFVALFTAGGAPWMGLLASLAILSIGSGLTRPPLFGMLSALTSANDQGFTIGVAQSSGALARIAGPVFASALYDWHPSVPYGVCAALALGACAWAWIGLRGEPLGAAGMVPASPTKS
jgi:MFS family permease